jgi:hypothetical protein
VHLETSFTIDTQDGDLVMCTVGTVEYLVIVSVCCWMWVYFNSYNMKFQPQIPQVIALYTQQSKGMRGAGDKNKLHGFSLQSELYRPNDRRLSAKLVPTLADKGCHVVSATNPHDR